MIGVKAKKNIPNILPTQQAKSVAEKKVNGSLAQQVNIEICVASVQIIYVDA